MLQTGAVERMKGGILMNIKILFDKKVPSREYASGLGFAALIDNRVLFDTG